VVLPGDNVTKHIISSSSPPDDANTTIATSTSSSASSLPKLGTGLYVDSSNNQVYATLAGKLDCNPKNRVYFVKQNIQSGRYRPALQDRVVGIVESRMGSDGVGGDLFQVNVGASHPAVISNLSFEGATKRNRPALHTGQVLYARIADFDASTQFLDPVLSCQLGPHDAGVPQKDWMTNESTYGELKGGTLCRISTGLARELLHPDNLVLAELSNACQEQNKRQGQQAVPPLAFEIAVGVNGFLWIHSTRPEYTILIQNAINNSSVLTDQQVRSMVSSLLYTVEKRMQMNFDQEEGNG